jgi:RNA polymerase subunit RPABC4/transcription elongation factor Spt4
MKKKECPSCAMEIDAKSKVCPICAYEFTSTGGGRKWIAVFLLILAIFWLLMNLF